VVSLRLRDPNFAVEDDYLNYLGEYEAICETALARESGTEGGLFDGKNEGQK
jgi:hypothetical protein